MTAKRAKAAPEFKERDRKELRRLIGKYGRKMVAYEVSTVELPKGRGRPRKDPSEAREHKLDIAEFIVSRTEEYHEARETSPFELALKDLYNVLRPEQPYERWCKTTLKNISPFRRDVKAHLKFAQELADYENALTRPIRERAVFWSD